MLLGHKSNAEMLERVYALFPRLKERRMQLAGTLSGGERQMLAVGRALMSKPALLMLDRPSLGLAPLVVRRSSAPSRAARHHHPARRAERPHAALKVSDHGYVLEMGEIALEGPAAELARIRA